MTDGQVLLDALTLEDAEAHWAGEGDEQARRFGWYPHRSTLERVGAHIVAGEAEWREGGSRHTGAIRDLGTRTLLGGCEVRLRDEATAHMSWWVFPSHRRRGIASRAVRLVTTSVFQALPVCEVEAFIEADNMASSAWHATPDSSVPSWSRLGTGRWCDTSSSPLPRPGATCLPEHGLS